MDASMCVSNSPRNRNIRPQVETVEFAGADLDCVYDTDKNEVYVSLRRACDALGIDYKSQHRKLQTMHWATMVIMTTVAADGKEREQSMLDLDTLGMWLATIDANRVNQKSRPTVMKYQKECVKVLRAHFFGKQAQPDLPEYPEPLITGRDHLSPRQRAVDWMMEAHQDTELSEVGKTVAIALMSWGRGTPTGLARPDEIRDKFLPGAADQGVQDLVGRGWLDTRWLTVAEPTQLALSAPGQLEQWMTADAAALLFEIDVDQIHAWGRAGAIERQQKERVWHYRIDQAARALAGSAREVIEANELARRVAKLEKRMGHPKPPLNEREAGFVAAALVDAVYYAFEPGNGEWAYFSLDAWRDYILCQPGLDPVLLQVINSYYPKLAARMYQMR